MQKKISKNIKYNSIEIFRILFTFIIIIFHIFGIIEPKPEVYQYCRHSRVIVEFFFIISGFFLYKSFLKDFDVKNNIIKRLIRLYPLYFFTIIFIALFNHVSFHKLVPQFMMFASVGFAQKGPLVAYYWFICPLFWISCFYFTMLALVKDKLKFNLINCILIYFATVILTSANTTFFEGSKNILTVFNAGMLRAILGIGIGILIAMNFSNIKIKLNKIFMTFIELFLSSYLISQLLFVTAKNVINYTLVFIIIFSFLFICLINNLGYFSELLNKINVSLVSRYCYAWYLAQCISKVIYPKECFEDILYIIVFLITTVIFGVLMYHLIEKPCAKYLTQKFFPQPQTLAAVEKVRDSNLSS